jgi:hypothetical protein
MSVTTLTPKNLYRPRGGVEDAAASVAADTTSGGTWANTGRQLVVLHQSGSTQRTIVVQDSSGNTIKTITLPAAANGQMVVGPFSVKKFGVSPVLIPSHAEVLFSVYSIDTFKSRGTSAIVVGGM